MMLAHYHGQVVNYAELARSLGIAESSVRWRTHNGVELDLYWEHQGKAWGIECKYMDAPSVSKSMNIAFVDLRLAHLWVVYPGTTGYTLGDRITVVPMSSLPPRWRYRAGLIER